MDRSGRESVRIHWRMMLLRVRAPAHATEDKEIEEVHPAKDEEHHAYLHG